MRKTLLLAAVVVFVTSALSALVRAQIAVGYNNNVTGCISDQYVCDPYLQRKVEPKGACSALNSAHCLFVANDYRTVSQNLGDGTGEGTTLASFLARIFGFKKDVPVAATPDAWTGVYRCYHGADGPCVNGLWPGCYPNDTTTIGMSGPEYGFSAGSDPACVTDDKGNFGCVSMAFTRGGQAIVVSRFWKDYNDESLHPIRLDQSIPANVLVRGAATAEGKFADLPTIYYDGFGNWHVAWTQFHSDGGHIWWTKSSDGGRTWSNPKNVSNPINVVQRVVFAANKTNGTVYAVFRRFGPDGFAMATLNPGGANFAAPVSITALSAPVGSTSPTATCTYDVPSRGTNEVPGDPTRETARARAFPTIDTDAAGNLFVAHSERITANGFPAFGNACNPQAPAAIVLTKFDPVAGTWTRRRAIDIGMRCETTPKPLSGHGPSDVTLPGDGCDMTGAPPLTSTDVVQRGVGIQLQPVLKSNGRYLVLMYREGRGGLGPEGYFSGRTSRMDIRAAQIDPGNLALVGTRQVSLYEFDPATGDFATRPGVAPNAAAPGVEKKVILPYLPQYGVGTTPFVGDSDDLIAVEQMITTSPGSHWATPAEVPALRMIALWGGDTREAGFPNPDRNIFSDGWTTYARPGTGITQCNPTIRFSNVMAAPVTGPVEAWASQTFKPLGSGNPVRTWPIVIRNRSNVTGRYWITLRTQPGFKASWDQTDINQATPSQTILSTATLSDGTGVGYVPILPGSTLSLTVFGAANPGMTDAQVRVPTPIWVEVDDRSTPENPDAIVRLNPNPIQYDNPVQLAGTGVNTNERHGRPSVLGPFVSTHTNKYPAYPTGAPSLGGPSLGGPSLGGPSLGGPSLGGPSLGGPSLGGPSLGGTTVTDIQYVVIAGTDTNTTSAFEMVPNLTNAAQLDPTVHPVQVIVSRTHAVATVNGCELALRPDSEIIAYTAFGPAPSLGGPSLGGPSLGGPSLGGPSLGGPSLGGPSLGGTTFTLTPSSTPAVGTSAAAAFAARAMASANAALPSAVAMVTGVDGTTVGDPPTDAVLFTIRIVGQGGPVPATPEDAANSVGVIVIPEADDSAGGNGSGGSAPVPINDAFITNEDTTLTVASSGVLANDYAVTADPLTATIGSGPAHASSFTLNANGSFVYTPAPNYNGNDSFTYTVHEGSLVSAVATVFITVNAVNDDPVAVGDSLTVEAGGSGGSVNVVSNDTDVDGDAVSVTGVGSPSHGSASASASAVTYTPAAGYVGPDSVTYTISDGHGGTATGIVSIVVRDTTPPVVTVPGNITREATSAAGAPVSFSPSAIDSVDGATAVTCTPASGSTFALTTTTVNCSATDAHGNSGAGSFTVTVVDTMPPTVTVPANITNVPATSGSGAPVSYTASATDFVSGAITPTCAPASGSTFPVGTTTVNCSATDARGNSASRSFTVTVVMPTAPSLTATASPSTLLWSPNKNRVAVTVSGAATGAGVTVVTYSVQDEYGQVQPSGTASVGGGQYSFVVSLEAYRNGPDADGRRYTITVRATDSFARTTTITTLVLVPHDQQK